MFRAEVVTQISNLGCGWESWCGRLKADVNVRQQHAAFNSHSYWHLKALKGYSCSFGGIHLLIVSCSAVCLHLTHIRTFASSRGSKSLGMVVVRGCLACSIVRVAPDAPMQAAPIAMSFRSVAMTTLILPALMTVLASAYSQHAQEQGRLYKSQPVSVQLQQHQLRLKAPAVSFLRLLR
eukprot:2834172-Amphidinium_carterae.1